MPWPKVRGQPRSRNKDGRIRKKRRDAHDYKEREVQRPLPPSDQGPEGSHSLSEQVVAAIQRGLRERNLKRMGVDVK